jgi:hypothetical protein
MQDIGMIITTSLSTADGPPFPMSWGAENGRSHERNRFSFGSGLGLYRRLAARALVLEKPMSDNAAITTIVCVILLCLTTCSVSNDWVKEHRAQRCPTAVKP